MRTIKNQVRNYCSALMLFRIDKRLGLPMQALCETTHENSIFSCEQAGLEAGGLFPVEWLRRCRRCATVCKE